MDQLGLNQLLDSAGDPIPPILHVPGMIEDPEEVYENLLNYGWNQEQIMMYGKKFDEPRKVMWFAPKGETYIYAGKKNEPREMTPLLRNLGRLCSAKIKDRIGERLRIGEREEDRLGEREEERERIGGVTERPRLGERMGERE